MEYTVPACPAVLSGSVFGHVAWTAGVAAMATRCQAMAADQLAPACEDVECGDTRVCDRCSAMLEMSGIEVDMMLPSYLGQVESVAIQCLAEYDPLGVESLTNLVARNVLAIQM